MKIPLKGFHFDHRSCPSALQGRHDRSKIDRALPHSVVGVPFAVIIVDMHVAKTRIEKTLKAPVKVSVPGIEGEPGPFYEIQIFRVPQVKELHVSHVFEIKGKREIVRNLAEFVQGFFELLVRMFTFLHPRIISRVDNNRGANLRGDCKTVGHDFNACLTHGFEDAGNIHTVVGSVNNEVLRVVLEDCGVFNEMGAFVHYLDEACDPGEYIESFFERAPDEASLRRRALIDWEGAWE